MPARTRAPFVLATATAASVLLAGCVAGNPLDTGDSVGDGSTVTIGSQGFPENEILAQIYGQVLEESGFDVTYDLSIGAREVFLEALHDGAIDLVPDYAGQLLYGSDITASAKTLDEIRAALPEVLKPLGLEALIPAAAENSDALVVTSTFAAANGLVSIGDLAPIASTLTIGAGAEFRSRWFRPLSTTYGVTDLTFRAIDDHGGATTVQNLLDNVIQLADIDTTSPAITENDLVVLEDPQNLFPAQNVIPLLDADLYSGELAGLLNAVSAALTTAELTGLNALYAGEDKPSAAEIATQWLTSKGFV